MSLITANQPWYTFFLPNSLTCMGKHLQSLKKRYTLHTPVLPTGGKNRHWTAHAGQAVLLGPQRSAHDWSCTWKLWGLLWAKKSRCAKRSSMWKEKVFLFTIIESIESKQLVNRRMETWSITEKRTNMKTDKGLSKIQYFVPPLGDMSKD